MRTIKIDGIEARVLSPRERDRAEGAIREYLRSRDGSFAKIAIATPLGQRSGIDIYNEAQVFEFQIRRFPVERQLDITETYRRFVDALAQAEPDFFELPHLNGKNILAGTMAPEMAVIKARESLKVRSGAAALDSAVRDYEYITEGYGKVRGYLRKAIGLFDASKISDSEPSTVFYRQLMESYLARSYRREGFFVVRTKSKDEIKKIQAKTRENIDADEWVSGYLDALRKGREVDSKRLFVSSVADAELQEPMALVIAALDIYKRHFSEGVFASEHDLAVALQNYANCLKMFKTEQVAKHAIACLEAARARLGDEPCILEDLQYFRA
ncbi:MAG: hypothetical protein QXL81_02790 [Candidatus Aenigmatarchaeota archaeon]